MRENNICFGIAISRQAFLVANDHHFEKIYILVNFNKIIFRANDPQIKILRPRLHLCVGKVQS